uniref:Uncharacterized protein n=1 Tax=Tanacetum cinerariifolium TaxID=118510 RepID=A0A6L2L8X5_TANCI|nr:hypothetical protein [Tanacetum cinerariifolium]
MGNVKKSVAERTQSSDTRLEVQDDNSRSGNDTDANDVDIRPIYDEEPMAEVQLTAEFNIFAIGQQHTEQPDIINEGKLFDSCISKVDSEPIHSSNVDTPNIHESKQTLDLSAGTSINVQKEQSLDLSTVGYRVLIDLILHRSSINNNARLSNKFREFFFVFKFGISGLLHQVIIVIADRIRGFPAQSVWSSNSDVPGLPCLLVLIIETSQSRQHEEFQQPEFESYGPKSCKIESKNASENISNELKESTEVKESFDVVLVKKLVSDDKLEKKTIFPHAGKIEFIKAKQQEKPVRKLVKYAEMYRSQGPRRNQKN